MDFSSQEEFNVLHGLRVRGITQPAGVADVVGLDATSVERILDHAVSREFAKKRTQGRLPGYMLTPAGRGHHEKLRDEFFTEPLHALERAYEAFLQLNQDFKEMTMKWQTEADGDPSVILAVLDALNEELQQVLLEASKSVRRFRLYEARFDWALLAFKDGESDALAKPMSGSYHDIWMELHEDLLLVLGRERTAADG